MDQLRCTIVDHDSAIEALCVNLNCTAPQKVVCFLCLVDFHHPCKNQLLTKSQLIERLNCQKKQIEADQRINDLKAEFLNIKTKIVKQLAILNEEIDQLFLKKDTRINRIQKIVDESQFKLDSWMDAYNLVINQTDYFASEFEAINKSLNQFRMSFNHIFNTNQEISISNRSGLLQDSTEFCMDNHTRSQSSPKYSNNNQVTHKLCQITKYQEHASQKCQNSILQKDLQKEIKLEQQRWMDEITMLKSQNQQLQITNSLLQQEIVLQQKVISDKQQYQNVIQENQVQQAQQIKKLQDQLSAENLNLQNLQADYDRSINQNKLMFPSETQKLENLKKEYDKNLQQQDVLQIELNKLRIENKKIDKIQLQAQEYQEKLKQSQQKIIELENDTKSLYEMYSFEIKEIKERKDNFKIFGIVMSIIVLIFILRAIFA